MVCLLEYDLPDHWLVKDTSKPFDFLVWAPHQTCVVLGRSNRVAQAVYEENCHEDKVPVYQRATGGQSVILSPKMLAVSISRVGGDKLASQEYFRLYNSLLINSLHSLGVQGVSSKGISDLAIGEKKIAGTALYRNRHKVFYHAIINVHEEVELIERYLRFPKRVPDYRKGRSHIEFVTSLWRENYFLQIPDLKDAIAKELRSFANEQVLSSTA